MLDQNLSFQLGVPRLAYDTHKPGDDQAATARVR